MKRGRDEHVETSLSVLDREGSLEKPGTRVVAKGVSVKVKHLRPRWTDLRAWLACDTHHLATRHGRVFIGSGDAKEVFHYSASEWANPFTVKEHGLAKSLRLYREHLNQLLCNDDALARFLQMGKKTTEIGCFCDPGADCHREIIVEKLNELLHGEGTEKLKQPKLDM